MVPRSCKVIPEFSSDKIIISASYNPLGVIAAIFQTLYASFTLYETRGDQLTRYGYAAFGLTVAPYLVMSIVNLFGSLATPTYDTMYLVRSEALGELEGENKGKPCFGGIVGKISEGDDQSTSRESFLSFLLMLETNGLDTIPVVAKDAGNIGRLQKYSTAAVIGIPFVIMGVLTGFHPGQSTKHERVWTMIWYVFGGLFGWAIPIMLGDFEHDVTISSKATAVLRIFYALMCGVGTIGGLVMVGKMLKEYGNCIRLG